jgi:hypothetical protein
MKKFIIKTLVFIISISSLIYSIFFCANGYTDPFYIRFTTPKQSCLIIGTSRAAQGLQPKVFKEIINKNIFNYSFTVDHSPFGPVYFNSIKKKNNKESNSYFIVTVDPWSISSWDKNTNDYKLFRENKLCVANTNTVNLNPNFEYLLNNLQGRFYKLLIHYPRQMFLHNDGWLEIKDLPMDSLSVSSRIKSKTEMYSKILLPKAHFSEYRLSYLIKTILYLKKYGKVFLVRLPIHPELMKIENNLMPNFNVLISNAIKVSDNYWDLTNLNDNFLYVDGNHLYKTSGKKVSQLIAERIYKQIHY